MIKKVVVVVVSVVVIVVIKAIVGYNIRIQCMWTISTIYSTCNKGHDPVVHDTAAVSRDRKDTLYSVAKAVKVDTGIVVVVVIVVAVVVVIVVIVDIVKYRIWI